MTESHEIIDILRDIVKATSVECKIIPFPCQTDDCEAIQCPEINYIFGSSEYVKDSLDIFSKISSDNVGKFPLIALFLPVTEQRNKADYYSKARIRVLIACSTSTGYNNEERLEYSFKNILRPIYRNFLEALSKDPRLFWGADEHISHDYSENYDYGKYGAFTQSGEKVSEPIDAINITNLDLTIKLPTCL